MSKKITEQYMGKQQGYVYVHEIELLSDEPTHFKLHAIMLHQIPFHIPEAGVMRTSFTTLDIHLDSLKETVIALKNAIPRFIMVEAEILVDQLKLHPYTKETGIPRTYGELIGIETAVMKCRS